MGEDTQNTPDTSDTPDTPDTAIAQIQKLNEDKPLDFRFHAAYTAYSKAWDENSSEETRAKLNELISSLKGDDASYEMFYGSLGQFRKDRVEYQSRSRVRVQRKMEWRKSEARNARNARHKK
jgi:hypothetical protein